MTYAPLPMGRDPYQLDLGEYIELFAVDARIIMDDSNAVFYFTPNTDAGNVVYWKPIDFEPEDSEESDKVPYNAMDIKAEGFESSSRGGLPRPTLEISNVPATGAGILLAYLKGYDDLVGAKVVRYRTLKKYLYGGSAQNFLAHWPEDRYVISQKLEHDPVHIKWQLNCALDASGRKLPSRLILRDSCPLIYRKWNSSTGLFDYSIGDERCPINNRRFIVLGDVNFSSNAPALGNSAWIWDVTSGFSIAGGTASCSSSGTKTLQAYSFAVSGTTYISRIKVNAIAGGSASVKVGQSGTPATFSTTGTHYLPVVAGDNTDGLGNNPYFIITAGSGVSLTLDSAWLDVYFDVDNANVTTYSPASDVCSRRLSACQLRWWGNKLPFGGFPGVARVRV